MHMPRSILAQATAIVTLALFLIMPLKHGAFAAEDSPEFREAIQAATLEYIDATAIDGKNLVFDAISGDFMTLDFVKLHPRLVKIADVYYVSCADFVDATGARVELDYLLTQTDGYWIVAQVVVHVRNDKNRAAHMEDKQVIFMEN